MIERRQFESDRFADQSFDSQRFGTRQRFDEDQQLGTTEPMRRTDSQWRFQEDQEFRTTDRTTTRDRFRDDRFRDDQMRDDRFRDDRFRDDRMRSTGTWQTDRELRMRERGDDRSWREQGRMQPSSRFQERRLETTRVYGSDFDTQPMILGITMSDLDRNELSRMRTERSYSSGVRVERVHEGMAADRAGLQPGDIIVRVDNEPATSNTLQRKASSKSPGESLNLRVLRDGRERNLNVRISSTGTTVRQFGTMDPWEEAVPPVQPEMPNVQHPGPYNVYRPTEPDWTNINRDTTVRSDRFRDDRFYGTDQRIYRDRPDRFDVREYRSDRYYTDTPPEFRDSRTYEFRTDPGQGFRDDRFEFRTDDRMYRTREFDSMDRPRDLRDDRFETRYRYEGPRSDRMHWDSGDARLHTTYEFDDDRFTTTYRLLEDDRPSADVRRGRIYGTDDRIYGTLDYDRDVYLDRNVDVRFRDNTLPGPMAPSTKFDNLDMPNVEHPGPFNIYRPTEPMVRERWEYRR